MGQIAEVVFFACSFCGKTKNNKIKLISTDIIIIGNKYDNPELLEVK